MHRHLFRAACGSILGPRKLPREAQRVQKKNASQIFDSSQASYSSPFDDNQFGWRHQSGSCSAQLQIVNALRLGEREKASKMLLNLGQEDGSLNANNFALILDYCARTPDPMFTMETLKVMKEKAIEMNKRCCRYIIQALVRSDYFKEAFKWLSGFEDNDCVGALPMYNIYLRACANAQRFADADHCLELMESRLLGKSEITYWELLKLAVSQNNLPAVHEIWEDCNRYYSPSIITLRKFIWSFTRLYDVQSAYNVLQHMVILASKGMTSLRISAKGRYQTSKLDIPIPYAKDVPGNRLQMKKNEYFLNSLSRGTLQKTNECLHHNSINAATMERQSSHIGENLNLGLTAVTPFELSKTADKIFCGTIGSGFSKGEDTTSNSNSQIAPSVSCASVIDSEYCGVMQGRCTQVTWESMKGTNSKLLVPKEAPTAPVTNFLRWSFNDLVHACARSDCFELAERLFLQMRALGLEPSAHTYDGYIKAAIYRKGVAYGMKLIKELEIRGIKPYDDTLLAIAVAYAIDLELELAEAQLRRISNCLPKHIYAFNIFLAACSLMDEPERAVRIMAKMKHLNIKSNIKTYELLYSLFGNVNVPYEKGNILSHADAERRIKIIEMDMMKNGIQHSYKSLKNLIRALGSEGMIQEMLRYLNFAENMLWHANADQRTSIYNIVLHSLVKAKQYHLAIDVFKKMRSYYFPVNVAIYNIMIECCSILTCYRSACALVSIMLRDGYPPQTLTYTALIKVLLANEDFDGALSLLHRSTSAGIQPDIQLFNTILRQAYPKGRIDIIEFIVEHIHSKKIQPNPSTCWYTFSAYVERGFLSTAMEALQVLSMWMISEDRETLLEKKDAFEDLIYNEEPYAEAQIVEFFKDSQEFLATALLNLRFCAITGFSLSWSLEDSQWLKRLSYNSRRPPL